MGKPAYPTREVALEEMRDTWNIQHGSFAAVRVYKCGCGSFHLTHKPERGGIGR